jgi:hypothetical protein
LNKNLSQEKAFLWGTQTMFFEEHKHFLKNRVAFPYGTHNHIHHGTKLFPWLAQQSTHLSQGKKIPQGTQPYSSNNTLTLPQEHDCIFIGKT